jgi:hypothetical protein
LPALVRGKKKLEFDGGSDAIDVEISTSSGSVRLLSNYELEIRNSRPSPIVSTVMRVGGIPDSSFTAPSAQ